MKYIKSIHVIGLICVVDLIWGSSGVFTVLILFGYGLFRLEKCPDCEEKKPADADIKPIPKDRDPLPTNPNSNIQNY